jgi:hypothetical protein
LDERRRFNRGIKKKRQLDETPEQFIARRKRQIMNEADESENDDDADIDDVYCSLAFYFQKELNITLTDDYPVARFNILKQEAIKKSKKEKEYQEKNGRR